MVSLINSIMKTFNPQGTGVAIVTPFNTDSSVDHASLKKLTKHLIDGGVEYVVVLGTTGESVTLTAEEKKEVVKTVVETCDGKLPVVLGIGGNNTHEVEETFKKFDLNGISAILSVSPYYNKPSQEGIYRHYEVVSKCSPLPVILYNVPGRTGSNMLPETTLRIASDFNNIIAIKEASGNLEQCMRIIRNKPESFTVISGDDNLTLPMIAVGAKGVISVVANAYPRIFSDMVRAALRSDLETAKPLHYKLFEFTEYLFADGNPGGIKAALEVMDICKNQLRLPLVPVKVEVQKKIETLIKTIG